MWRLTLLVSTPPRIVKKLIKYDFVGDQTCLVAGFKCSRLFDLLFRQRSDQKRQVLGREHRTFRKSRERPNWSHRGQHWQVGYRGWTSAWQRAPFFQASLLHHILPLSPQRAGPLRHQEWSLTHYNLLQSHYISYSRLVFWTFFGNKNQVDLAKPWVLGRILEFFRKFLEFFWKFLEFIQKNGNFFLNSLNFPNLKL